METVVGRFLLVAAGAVPGLVVGLPGQAWATSVGPETPGTEGAHPGPEPADAVAVVWPLPAETVLRGCDPGRVLPSSPLRVLLCLPDGYEGVRIESYMETVRDDGTVSDGRLLLAAEMLPVSSSPQGNWWESRDDLEVVLNQVLRVHFMATTAEGRETDEGVLRAALLSGPGCPISCSDDGTGEPPRRPRTGRPGTRIVRVVAAGTDCSTGTADDGKRPRDPPDPPDPAREGSGCSEVLAGKGEGDFGRWHGTAAAAAALALLATRGRWRLRRTTMATGRRPRPRRGPVEPWRIGFDLREDPRSSGSGAEKRRPGRPEDEADDGAGREGHDRLVEGHPREGALP